MKTIFTYLIFIFVGLITISCDCCTTNKKTSDKTETEAKKKLKRKQDSLAYELCQIYGLDQGLRTSKGFANKMRLVQSIDTFNFNRIVDFIKANGVPDETLLGKENYSHECVKAVFGAVMLHNPHRLVNEKKYLLFFADLVKKGVLKEEALLLILDKYYWTKSKDGRVLYGSQFGMPCKEDKEKTNRARSEIGIAPLADSLFIDCK